MGGSGSGKTWLARKLQKALGPRGAVLSLDDFYRDLSHLTTAEREHVNFDNPGAIDWETFAGALGKIRKGVETWLPEYDFTTHTRRKEPRGWRSVPVVLIDGLWLLHRPGLRRLYDLSVYLDCPESLRLRRRLRRDQRERGRSRASILSQFRRQVAPMHDRFVAPQADHADLRLERIDARTLASILKKLESYVTTGRSRQK